MNEEIEVTEFEAMQPRAAAMVKDVQLRELKSNLEFLFRDIGNSDLYLLNDLLTDWISLTTRDDGTFAAVLAVRFGE